ncbi:MAG: hypothetical protein JW715_01470, partial [Sedimentisphaerales bacterium]|nr:hypothetical protein [Sedimentisphaerales bacterium]
MKRMCLLIGLVCFLSSGVFAVDYTGVGNWADPNGWSDGAPPTGAVEVKVRGEDTVLTLNTSTGDWGEAQRMRVYEGATLIIEEGAELLGAGWTRIGAGSPGYVIQTGGLVQIPSERLSIGDSDGSDGHYTVSGGTITYTGDRGDLTVGARGGQGILTIVGSAPVILMEELIVGDRAGASGTVEFQIDAAGVSPIVLSNVATVDELGDETTSALLVNAIDTPPMADILLVDITSDANVANVFDTVNGNPAAEGALVQVNFEETIYSYTLTYIGGTGNDIVLVFDSVEGSEPVQAGLAVTNGTFDGGDPASADVPDWYDVDVMPTGE